MITINQNKEMIDRFKKEMQEFSRICESFYNGEISVGEYKSISGGFGTYSEREHKTGMLRLRIPAGDLSNEQFDFILDKVEKYNIEKIHFTTNQSIQLHGLNAKTICQIMQEALDVGIITRGGGGDFPRNAMCSPLSGVQQEEYFDVLPYAKAVSNYVMNFIGKVKLPRKLKIGFSNCEQNIVHATFRDMGFVARPDGKFDLYTAGGLGPNPEMGIKTAESIEPKNVLYYVKAMVKMFTTYGNYETRAKARTRYIPRAIGEKKYVSEFTRMLEETMAEENLTINITTTPASKKSDGSVPKNDRNIVEQKQEGLYAVKYHPMLGYPSASTLNKIYEEISSMQDVSLRLSTKEEAYIINLTGAEADKILDIINDETAYTKLQESVSCVGSTVCQVGIADSKGLLQKIIDVDKEENFSDGTLPQICISGCQSSCAAQQSAIIGFKGGKKKIDGEMTDAFEMTIGGNESQNNESFGETVGTISSENIPEMFRNIGREVEKSGITFDCWFKNNKNRLIEIAKEYTI